MEGELPTVATREWRRAAKEHRCCECGLPIHVGHTYEHFRGLWCGTWQTHRSHVHCADLSARVTDSFEYPCAFGCAYEAAESDDWLRIIG